MMRERNPTGSQVQNQTQFPVRIRPPNESGVQLSAVWNLDLPGRALRVEIETAEFIAQLLGQHKDFECTSRSRAAFELHLTMIYIIKNSIPAEV